MVRSASLRSIVGTAIICALAAACSSSPSQPDGGTVCAQGMGMCTATTACTNSDCVPTCDGTGAGCPAGFYCESPTAPYNVCSPITASECSTDYDCPAPQQCAYGLCLSVEERADGGTEGCDLSDAIDGCAPDSICYQLPDSQTGQSLNYCVGLEHCSEDGGCPADSIGAVCNQQADGGMLFAFKERLCLSGYCVDDTNCPSGNACFHRSTTDPIGQCQNGAVDDPCYTNADCFNATECDVDAGVQDDGGSIGTCN